MRETDVTYHQDGSLDVSLQDKIGENLKKSARNNTNTCFFMSVKACIEAGHAVFSDAMPFIVEAHI